MSNGNNVIKVDCNYVIAKLDTTHVQIGRMIEAGVLHDVGVNAKGKARHELRFDEAEIVRVLGDKRHVGFMRRRIMPRPPRPPRPAVVAPNGYLEELEAIRLDLYDLFTRLTALRGGYANTADLDEAQGGNGN